LWAVGTLLALVTIALLVALLLVNREAVKWEDLLSRERIEQVALFIGITVALTTLFVLLAIGGASLGWTGFGDKTFWDWLQLLSALAIPVVLAAAGLWFTAQQDARQQKIEDRRANQAQRIENQRAESEQEIEEQRTQDAALQAYLDEMSSLVIGKNSLRNSEEDSEVRTLARARTLTALGRLDPKRKTALMQFLVEAKLVQRVDERPPLIGLSDANLSGAVLWEADLRGAHLIGADVMDANLMNADLRDADLRDADLSGARLRDADVMDANLMNADLSGAHLREATLWTARLIGADLTNADLRDADLSDADLRGADLSDADLRGADLIDANLSAAYLIGTDLRGADLYGADLPLAKGVTKERLKQQAKSLNRAQMPDGTVLYATSEFDPALSFTFDVDNGWQTSAGSDTPAALSIDGPEGGELIFTSPLQVFHVFDSTGPSELKKRPAPENTDEWVSWFRSHSNLNTSKPVPMSVGGTSGVRIDVTNTSAPENYPREVCGGQPCVPLYRGSTNESMIVSYDRWKDRFIIVDVGGETVIIDVAAPADKFDEFVPKARKFLDTLEWKRG
jgi:uncharacterized protein YjbI with pentapeptide repeats